MFVITVFDLTTKSHGKKLFGVSKFGLKLKFTYCCNHFKLKLLSYDQTDTKSIPIIGTLKISFPLKSHSNLTNKN